MPCHWVTLGWAGSFLEQVSSAFPLISMLLNILCCHDEAKCISQLLLLRQVLRIRIFLFLSSFFPVCHLPCKIEFAPKYFVSQNGNFSSWRCLYLEYRNFSGNVLGLSASFGATWVSSRPGLPVSWPSCYSHQGLQSEYRIESRP